MPEAASHFLEVWGSGIASSMAERLSSCKARRGLLLIKRRHNMPHDFMPGLAGVPAPRPRVSDVGGPAGGLEDRGIRIEELAAESTFLETAYLLPFNPFPAPPGL